MRQLIVISVVVAALAGTVAVAQAANKIIYVHGRGQMTFNTAERVNVSGTSWQPVALSFDGGASINGPATATVRTALEQQCAVGTGNTCIVVCYSAGCLRFLKAVRDSSHTTFNIVRVSAIASAAGGTKIAVANTTGSLKSIAKLIGQQEAVDWDLTPAVARGTYGSSQNAMDKTSGTMWHYCGYKDTCVSLLFFKMCGNTYVNSGLTGARGDGLVSYDSCGGSSVAGAFNNLCASGGTGTKRITSRYSKRAPGGACDGEHRDHAGMVGAGVKYTEQALAVTPTGDQNLTWGDTTSQSTCSDTASCGNAFTNQAADFATLRTQGGTPVTVSPSTDATSSNSTTNTASATSCTARCGLYQPGRACQCDAACVSGGDCCADYAAANCPNVKVW